MRLDAGSTAVVFSWTGDRWTHRLETTASDASSEWTSVDEPMPPTMDPRWPSSPVLVELSRLKVPGHGAAGGSAILGVGLAGRSHFSASITPDPGAADTIRFEIACRLHGPPGRLGSTYRNGERVLRVTPLDASTELPRTVVWAYSIGRSGIVHIDGAAVSIGAG